MAKFRDAKADCLRTWWTYQRGANDVSGYERDCEWRAAVRSARGWDDLFFVLPVGHPCRELVANRGDR